MFRKSGKVQEVPGEELTDYIPLNILQSAKDAEALSVPSKSTKIYRKVYDEFIQWQTKNKTSSFDERVFLAYFKMLSESLSSATLWSKFSMLKSMVRQQNNISLKSYEKLQAFLKQNHTGYKAKKAKIFAKEELNQFLNDAPDVIYLATKVALIIGISGACRREELHDLSISNISFGTNEAIIPIPKTKNYVPRSFVVNQIYLHFILRYLNLRPTHTVVEYFFLGFNKGKCLNQRMGINKIGEMPSVAAKFLKLPDWKKYTGHSCRRTSATILADANADMATVQRHGGWKSSKVAEGYIESSLNRKRQISDMINNSIDIAGPSNNNNVIDADNSPVIKRKKTGKSVKSAIADFILNSNECCLQ